MNHIPLDTLLEKVDSRYSLVVAAAKRARQLTEKELQAGNKEIDYKVVSYALEEILDDRIAVKSKKNNKNSYHLK